MGKRQALDDGRWFDRDAATRFEEATWWNGHNHVSQATEEATWWNGHNHVSQATGSVFEHEALYRTVGGRWILHHWSQWQGSRDTWIEVNNEAAAEWLVCNKHEPHPACAAEYAALEVA